jgi:hypothetical protein
MFGPEVLTFIGTSVVINGLLAAAMIFLAKSWISERLRNAIEHEYKMKLETYKHQLRSEHDVAIERLRADVARDQALQSVVASSFSEGQRAAHERRLNAVEVIWKALVGMRDQLPIVIEVLDVLTPDKYHQVLGNPDIRKEINEMSEEGLAEISGKGTREAEMARPFYGEYIYSLFCA